MGIGLLKPAWILPSTKSSANCILLLQIYTHIDEVDSREHSERFDLRYTNVITKGMLNLLFSWVRFVHGRIALQEGNVEMVLE